MVLSKNKCKLYVTYVFIQFPFWEVKTFIQVLWEKNEGIKPIPKVSIASKMTWQRCLWSMVIQELKFPRYLSIYWSQFCTASLSLATALRVNRWLLEEAKEEIGHAINRKVWVKWAEWLGHLILFGVLKTVLGSFNQMTPCKTFLSHDKQTISSSANH